MRTYRHPAYQRRPSLIHYSRFTRIRLLTTMIKFQLTWDDANIDRYDSREYGGQRIKPQGLQTHDPAHNWHGEYKHRCWA